MNLIGNIAGTVAVEFALVLATVGVAFFVAGTAVATTLVPWLDALLARIAEGQTVLAALQAAAS